MEANPYGAPTGDLRGEPEVPGSPLMAVLFGVALLFVVPWVSNVIIMIALSGLHVSPFDFIFEVDLACTSIAALVAGYACARVAKRLEMRCGFLLVLAMFLLKGLTIVLSEKWPSSLGLAIGLGIGFIVAGTLLGAWRTRVLRRENAAAVPENTSA